MPIGNIYGAPANLWGGMSPGDMAMFNQRMGAAGGGLAPPAGPAAPPVSPRGLQNPNSGVAFVHPGAGAVTPGTEYGSMGQAPPAPPPGNPYGGGRTALARLMMHRRTR